MSDALYPPSGTTLAETARGYKDEAAAALYKDNGGFELSKAHAAMARAFVKQAEKMAEFHSTPFTKQNQRTLNSTIEGLEHLERLLERWHLLIYPNQRPDSKHDVG